MRHTAVTRIAETGADIKTIQEFSGHESLQMALRYAHAKIVRSTACRRTFCQRVGTEVVTRLHRNYTRASASTLLMRPSELIEIIVPRGRSAPSQQIRRLQLHFFGGER
jgi:Phage integrase family